MSLPASLISTVHELARSVQLDAAEEVLIDWWTNAEQGVVTSSEDELRRLIRSAFLKKRTIKLEKLLSDRIWDRESPAKSIIHNEAARKEAASHPSLALPIPSSAEMLPREPRLASEMVAASVDECPSWSTTLDQIAELNRRANPKAAEESFRQWLDAATNDEVTQAETKVRAVLDQFLRKRHNSLSQVFETRLGRAMASSSCQPAPEVGANTSNTILDSPAAPDEEPRVENNELPRRDATDADQVYWDYITKRLDDQLADLRDHHIFQWNTYYRDTITEFIDPLMSFIEHPDAVAKSTNQVSAAIAERFRRHAQEIFQKGWIHSRAHADASATQSKAENGLQRFLDLPLEVYSARLSFLRDGVDPRALRTAISALLSGILRGFAGAHFDTSGSRFLPRLHRNWVRVLPFVTESDLHEILEEIQNGPIHLGIQNCILPFAHVIDTLLEDDSELAPLPKLSDYSYLSRRLKVTLQPPSGPSVPNRIEVQLYMSEDYVDKDSLNGAYSDAATAVLAPLHADLRAFVEHRDTLRAIVVPTVGLRVGDEPATRLRAILTSTLFTKNDPLASERPIDYNYAEAFPLTDASHAAYRHVERASVRQLLQRFDRSNGIRLWCSVRRSGKTTASALDLGSTSESAIVITETCDRTGKLSGSNHVFRAVRQAINEGRSIPDDFFTKALEQGLPEIGRANKVTYVLDEYETLFGNLRAAFERDRSLRYAIVQPLLNQMAEFAEQNLIVFLGQQPDAHYLLMSQNQLSAYVEQDQFPLFTHDHDAYRGEFHELLQRVLTSYVDYDRSFANAVFAETGGHPYLTVNILDAMFKWLIREKRPRSLLQGGGINGELFLEFTDAKLTRREILLQKSFEYFRKIAHDALAPEGRQDDPWLHSVYAALRRASLEAGPDFAIPRDEFVSIVAKLDIGLHDEPETVLHTASQANFLQVDGDSVRPRIRMLSRIAATVSAS